MLLNVMCVFFPFSVCDVFVLRFPCVVFVVFDALFVTFLFFCFSRCAFLRLVSNDLRFSPSCLFCDVYLFGCFRLIFYCVLCSVMCCLKFLCALLFRLVISYSTVL